MRLVAAGWWCCCWCLGQARSPRRSRMAASKSSTMYRPQGEARQTVLFFSGEHGWTADARAHRAIARSAGRAGRGHRLAGVVSQSGEGRRQVRLARWRPGEPEPLPAGLLSIADVSTRRCWWARDPARSSCMQCWRKRPPARSAAASRWGFCPTPALKKPLCSTGKTAHRSAAQRAVDGAARNSR